MAEFAGNDGSYIKVSATIPDLTKTSACWWAKTPETTSNSEEITYFSYTTDKPREGSFSANDITNFEMYVNGQRAYGGADFDIRYGIWHQLCVAWVSEGGNYCMYKDGHMLKEGKNFRKGETIKGGGVLHLAQYLKSASSALNSEYSFRGQMAGFDMFDYVVDLADIQAAAFSRSSVTGCGNVVAWSQIAESDLVGVETCDTVLTGAPRPDNCEGGEFAGKVLQIDSTVGPNGYAMSHGDLPEMKAFTLCAWGKTTEPNVRADMFSYRVQNNAIGSFVIRNPSNVRLFVNTKGAPESEAAINDGMWHHVCVTWASEGGKVEYYGDSALAKAAEGVSTGETIAGGGVVIIGVPQNRIGAKFDFKKRFNHELADFNIWSTVKSQAEIAMMMCGSCNGGCGDVVSWHKFTSNEISTDVAVKDSDVPYKKK
ncbi:uncharacterized protein [Ptychodera flava]|uniref:uncharacterized protein n=1 Tax=Ptychodera flava TaxID=63121 RepID=UPI00396A83F1